MEQIKIIEHYWVLNDKNNSVEKVFDTKEEANKFISEHTDTVTTFHIEFHSNREYVEDLYNKYEGCLVYEVSFVNDVAIITKEGTEFDYTNTSLLQFITEDGSLVSVIAKSQDDAMDKALIIKDKFLNKESLEGVYIFHL